MRMRHLYIDVLLSADQSGPGPWSAHRRGSSRRPDRSF